MKKSVFFIVVAIFACFLYNTNNNKVKNNNNVDTTYVDASNNDTLDIETIDSLIECGLIGGDSDLGI